MKHILLDSAYVGLLSNPTQSDEVLKIVKWVSSHIAMESKIYVPEGSDYEVRRELIRADKIRSIVKLDNLKNHLEYLPITTQTMLRAAELWAQSRNRGNPTSDPKRLDFDVVLSAQALLMEQEGWAERGEPVLVATTNAAHLSRFIFADSWENIAP